MAIGAWSLPAVASVVVFGAWFVLSVVGQFLHPHDAWVRKGPISWVVPDWRFFAPEPLVEDHLVVYRSKSRTAEPGPLVTMALPSAGAMRWLWNPEIRRQKALFDVTDGLHRSADALIDREGQTEFPDALVLTEPYLVLLNLVSVRRPQPSEELVQFGVVLRTWPDREELVFLSRWHRVEA